MNRRRVLIETSWNVKDFWQTIRISLQPVLIETSWNVKELVNQIRHTQEDRINRNIVECKDAIEDESTQSNLY